MSFSTQLLGPYDDQSTYHKTMVSASIPPEVRDRLFKIYLPRRGAIDKVLTRSIYLLDSYLQAFDESLTLSIGDREEIVNNIFNQIALFLQTLDIETVKPNVETNRGEQNSVS